MSLMLRHYKLSDCYALLVPFLDPIEEEVVWPAGALVLPLVQTVVQGLLLLFSLTKNC